MIHPVRQRLLFRLVLGGCILVAAVAWTAMRLTDPALDALFTRVKPLTMKADVPQAKDQQMVADAAAILERDPAPEGVWTANEPRLIEMQERREIAALPELRMILLGSKRKLAVIGNSTYGAGDALPDGRVVASVNRTGVALESRGEITTLKWTRPGEIRLVKPEPVRVEKTVEPVEEAQTRGQEAGPAGRAGETQGRSLNVTPQQLQQLLNQLGGTEEAQ